MIGRAEALLALGTAAGIAMAAMGIARPEATSQGLPEGAIARVNGVSIHDADYRRAVKVIAAERRAGVDAALRRRAIDRLIDEELLVQRGVELGLASRDLRVRNQLSAAVIDLIVARAEQTYRPPGEATLRAFFRDNAGYFRGPDLLRVEQLYVAGRGAAARAGELARRARAGESFAALAASADAPDVPLPKQPIPVAKLRDYLGPTAARRALSLAPGAVSAPIPTTTGSRVIRVAERITRASPPYAKVEALVRAEHRRLAGDRALRRFLTERRAASRITVARERL